jgi:hypothetical protein
MNEVTTDARPLTSVELLDAAVWREIGSEEPQPQAAFLKALSAIVGRWLLVRSNAPDIDLVTVMCRAHGYIGRRGQGETMKPAFKESGQGRPGDLEAPGKRRLCVCSAAARADLQAREGAWVFGCWA